MPYLASRLLIAPLCVLEARLCRRASRISDWSCRENYCFRWLAAGPVTVRNWEDAQQCINYMVRRSLGPWPTVVVARLAAVIPFFFRWVQDASWLSMRAVIGWLVGRCSYQMLLQGLSGLHLSLRCSVKHMWSLARGQVSNCSHTRTTPYQPMCWC